jgi:hypothetical protein
MTNEKMALTSANFETRLVTGVLMAACGDLMLDGAGHLCTKRTYDAKTYEALPAGQFERGQLLAKISRGGWKITVGGAHYMLECWPDLFSRGEIKRLEAITHENAAAAA